jgi:hypothetical protein
MSGYNTKSITHPLSLVGMTHVLMEICHESSVAATEIEPARYRIAHKFIEIRNSPRRTVVEQI